MRTPVRCLAPLAALVLALVLPACGGGKKRCLVHGIKCENLPRHKVYDVHWVERANFGSPPRPIAVFRVTRIEVGRNGWTISASFTNQSPRTFTLPKGGPRSPKDFGLGVFTTALPQRVEEPGNYLLQAESTTPPLPNELAPGQTWSGKLRSDVPPRSLRTLRVVFGVFFWKGKPPYNADIGPFFLWQTTHGVKAPPPLGLRASA